jgi:putative membrane protein
LRVLSSIVALAFLSLASVLRALVEGKPGGETYLTIIAVVVALFLVIVVLTVALSLVSYRRFLWEIAETDIHVSSGIIFKKQVHVPFTRVQSIDFHAGLIERLLGLVRVKIETAGGASNRGVIIPALKLAEAEALRAEALARARSSMLRQEAARPRFDPQTGQPLAIPRFDPQTGQPLPASPATQSATQLGAPAAPAVLPAAASANLMHEVGNGMARARGIFAEDYQEHAPVEYEYGLSARELFLFALSSDQNIVFFGVLVGIFAQLWQFADLFGFEDVAGQMVEALIDNLMMTGAGVLIVLLPVLLVVTTLSAVMLYGGFKARRRGGRIEVEHGLLSRQHRNVPIARVQAVEIRQGFIRSIFGYAQLKLLTIDSVSTDNAQRNAQSAQGSGLVVHPFVKMNKVAGILERLIPELNARPATSELRSLPKRALRRAIIRLGVMPGLLYAAVAAGVTVFLNLAAFMSSSVTEVLILALWILVAVLIARHFVGAILWYRHAGFAWSSTILLVRQGKYSQVTTIVPRRKIQWAATRQNPLQRLAKLATISAVTAAGVGGTELFLRDLTYTDAETYLDWLRPRGAGCEKGGER